MTIIGIASIVGAGAIAVGGGLPILIAFPKVIEGIMALVGGYVVGQGLADGLSKGITSSANKSNKTNEQK